MPGWMLQPSASACRSAETLEGRSCLGLEQEICLYPPTRLEPGSASCLFDWIGRGETVGLAMGGD